MNSVTYTTAGGSQSVLSTSVSQMRRIEDAFYVESIGSTLLLEGTKIEQNRFQANSWSAVSARTGSIARVSETSIVDNASVEFGIVSFDSSITVTDSIISGNVGTVCKHSASSVLVEWSLTTKFLADRNPREPRARQYLPLQMPTLVWSV